MRIILLTICFIFLSYRVSYYIKGQITSPVQVSGSNANTAKLNIDNMVLRGKDNRSFEYCVMAAQASRVEDDVFSLIDLNVEYFNQDGQMNLSAEHGLINKTRQFLTLEDWVKLQYGQYLLTSKKMELDFKHSIVYAFGGVQLKNHDSLIRSNKCVILNNPKDIVCKGNVQINLRFSGF